MKFITEDEFRDKYNKNPFTSYVITSSEKITSGARQFLTDRGIKMILINPLYKKILIYLK